MLNKPKTLGKQMTLWGTDGRIVPQKPSDQEGGMKPSNIGEGRRTGQHASQLGQRPYPVMDISSIHDWLASPNEQ